jgi:hypothetical protein
MKSEIGENAFAIPKDRPPSILTEAQGRTLIDAAYPGGSTLKLRFLIPGAYAVFQGYICLRRV